MRKLILFALAAAFELPANHKPSFIMPCGYASENAKPSDHHFSRKPLSETVTYKYNLYARQF